MQRDAVDPRIVNVYASTIQYTNNFNKILVSSVTTDSSKPVSQVNYIVNETTARWSNILEKPTTLAGYGITDSYTKAQVDALTWNWSSITNVGDITSTGSMYLTGTSSNYLRMRNGSAGAWQFYDVKDPGGGIYNYTVMMDNGRIGFYFSTVNTAYDIGTIKHTFNANGDILAVGNVTAYYSDERLKTKLGNITDALDKVDAIDCFYYEANDVLNR